MKTFTLDGKEMKTMDELCFEHGTDKGSRVGEKRSEYVAALGAGHDYARHYERLFESMRFASISILEIGVAHGASIKVWLEYFPHALVFGVDHGKDTCEWTRDESPVPGRYMFVRGDQGSAAFWDGFLNDYGRAWDIIIDDGSHFNDDVVLTFNKLWGAVAPRGCYCIEDLGTMNDLRPGPDHLTFLMGLVCELVGRRGSKSDRIDSIHLANELAILVKK